MKKCVFLPKKYTMFETANLHIDSQTLNRAYLYAQAHNLDLSAVIEAFLLQFSMGKIEDVRKIIISKEIMELAGSLPVNHITDDWKTEKEAYLTEKYCR